MTVAFASFAKKGALLAKVELSRQGQSLGDEANQSESASHLRRTEVGLEFLNGMSPVT